jgi:hypothetical protein
MKGRFDMVVKKEKYHQTHLSFFTRMAKTLSQNIKKYFMKLIFGLPSFFVVA